MSKSRATKTIPASQLPKGPNGRNLCRWCKVEVPKGRRTFCSDDCVHEYSIRSSPGYMRQCVGRRDKGVCAICGLDTRKLKRILTKLLHRYGGYCYVFGKRTKFSREATKIRIDKIGEKYPWAAPNSYHQIYMSSLWHADHVVPVVEGGGECGLDGVRTLCIADHHKVTKELRQRLKQKRLAAKAQQELFCSVAQCNEEDTMTNL